MVLSIVHCRHVKKWRADLDLHCLCSAGCLTGLLGFGPHQHIWLVRQGFQDIACTLQDAWAGLQEADFEFRSALLRSMAAGGAFVDMQGPLEELLGYTDWDLAAERGRIVPHPGSDASFDAAEQRVMPTQLQYCMISA